uniref:DEAD/DEAH box helicase n=1 Tax=Mycobacterium sp. TaxID=1785 RepID=UPI003F9858B2
MWDCNRDMWGNRNASLNECGVVVAGVQKLHAAVRGTGRELTPEDVEILGESTGVVVIDEAHRALAPSYTGVLNSFGIDFRRKRSATALFGLTATPRRASADETSRLHRRFHNRILHAPSLGADPVQTLRAQSVLAQVQFESLDYSAKRIDLATNSSYARYYEDFDDVHPAVLKKLGEEHRRNRRILERLLQLDPRWSVLLFACSIQHAQAMASLLQRNRRSAACVLGTTRPAVRRALIERFRDGHLSVLSNYGVLTTGFDAPSVRCVVVARPTTSRILYEQMVGRGMRGPEFGGTNRCLVVDVDDNIQWRDRPAAIDYRWL